MNNRQLLQKFLNGLCSPSEQQRVKTLLDTKEGKTILIKLMEELDLAADQYEKPGIDEKDLGPRVQYWKKLVHERMAPIKKNDIRPIRSIRILRQAAVWVGLIFTFGIAAWQIKRTLIQQDIVYIKKENTKGVPVRYILPDSSSIYLAAGSSLSYAEDFPEKGRDIKLTGAAFFDVKRDEAKPFTIHTGKVQTQVLGTSFKVTAFEGELLEVAVATGKVAVGTSENKNKIAILTPGKKVSFDPLTKKAKLSIIAIDGLEQWKSGELIFDDQPLELVVKELQRRYGVRVVCRDRTTAAYRVSGSFGAKDSIETILKMLSILGKFNYEMQRGSIYYLSKTGHM